MDEIRIPQHIARVFELLTTQYPEYGRDLSVDQMRKQMLSYALFLRDIDPAILEAATVSYIASNKWFPKVSELRQCALELITYDSLGPEEAWGELKRLIKRYGSYGEYLPEAGQYRIPQSPNALVNRAIEIMDWKTLCASDNDVADRAHFFKIFSALVERSNRTTMMLPQLKELAQAMSSRQLKAG